MIWNRRYGVGGWNPWLEMQRLQTEVNRVFRENDHADAREFPAIDLWSNDEGLKFHAQLPGFDAKDIALTVVGDTLKLEAAREPLKLDEGQTRRREERVNGRVVRTIQLPFAVDADAVKAIYTNGIFKPLNDVEMPENQRVRLTVEPVETAVAANWVEAVRQFQKDIVARHGVLPDSMPDIAADRRRHE